MATSTNNLFLGIPNSKLATALCETLSVLGISHALKPADLTIRLKSAAKAGKTGIPYLSFPLQHKLEDVFIRINKHLRSAGYYPQGHYIDLDYIRSNYVRKSLHEAREGPELRLVSWGGVDNQWNHPGIVSINTRYMDTIIPEYTLDLAGYWFIQALYATLCKDAILRLPLPWGHFAVWFAIKSEPDAVFFLPSGSVCHDGQSNIVKCSADAGCNRGLVCAEMI